MRNMITITINILASTNGPLQCAFHHTPYKCYFYIYIFTYDGIFTSHDVIVAVPSSFSRTDMILADIIS